MRSINRKRTRSGIFFKCPNCKNQFRIPSEEKIESIKAILCGIHAHEMTEAELGIRDIVFDKKATKEEKGWGRKNSETIEFVDD